ELKIDIVSNDSEIMHLFSQNILDLAFVYEPLMDRNLEWHLIESEEIELVVSTDHPLSTCKSFSDIHLLGLENIILYTPFNHLIEQSGLSSVIYNRKLRTNNLEIIKNLIISNLGISFLPRGVMGLELNREDIVHIPIDPKIIIDTVKYFM